MCILCIGWLAGGMTDWDRLNHGMQSKWYTFGFYSSVRLTVFFHILSIQMYILDQFIFGSFVACIRMSWLMLRLPESFNWCECLFDQNTRLSNDNNVNGHTGIRGVIIVLLLLLLVIVEILSGNYIVGQRLLANCVLGPCFCCCHNYDNFVFRCSALAGIHIFFSPIFHCRCLQ